MTDTQLQRDDLLRRCHEAHGQLEEVLSTLTDEEMLRPGFPPGWSVKDHLAHLAWWEQQSLQMLAGQPDPTEAIAGDAADEDTALTLVNEWIFTHNNERPLAEVRAAFDVSYQELLQMIESLPEETLAEQNEWISSNADHHYLEHLRMLRSWFERQR